MDGYIKYSGVLKFSIVKTLRNVKHHTQLYPNNNNSLQETWILVVCLSVNIL